MFRGDFYSCFFLAEFLLLAIGSLILFNHRFWTSPRWLFITAVMMLLGGALYRFNVYLIGFNPGRGWRYFPSFPEVMISVGIVAIELLGYQLLTKLLPVLPTVFGQVEIAEQANEGSEDTPCLGAVDGVDHLVHLVGAAVVHRRLGDQGPGGRRQARLAKIHSHGAFGRGRPCPRPARCALPADPSDP
mgnify:CR=1 FL=1